MTLKMICLEEHAADPALREAAQPGTARQAPYYADLNSRFRDDADAPGSLPALRVVRDAVGMTGQPIEQRLAAMDEAGIDVQLLSYTDLTQLIPAAQAPDLARGANDRLAGIAAAHPDRFAGFLTLPWQDADAACRELERAGHLPGVAGCMLAGHPGEGVLVDDPRFAPVLAKLAELGLPLYIHPGPPLPAVQRAYYAGFDKDVTARLSLISWGWHNEAGMQVVRLILSGALDRLPDLRIVSGHWGEMVPFFLQRMDDTMPRGATGLSRTVSQTYRDQVYVTPSGMLNLPHFRFCREVLGAGRIMFAVDYPYLTMRGARRWLEELPVTDEERALIAHGNAERALRLG